jgi:hypothetical protein
MAQDRLRLARVVIAVMKKENDLSSDFALQPPGGFNLRVKKSPWKKPAGLLAKTNDRGCAHAVT